jgi:type II secretion system protein C
MLLPVLVFLALSPPDLTAVGVVHGARPEAGVALLRAGGRTRVARVGASAFGGRVVAVEAERVVVEFDGVRSVVLLAGPLAQTPPRELAPVAAPVVALAPAAPAIRSLPRADLERRLAAEIPRILAQTAVAPVSAEGRPAGVRLIRIAQGTLLTEVGLRAGDVLVQINDVPTDSLAALMALWPRLQGATDLRATVLRDGRPVALSLDLR